MRKVIICSPIYDFENKKFTIGGIQTYIRDLIDILCKNDYQVVLCQIREEYNDYEEVVLNNITIEKYPAIKKRGKFKDQYVFDVIYEKYNKKDTLFIVDTDQRDIKSSKNNVVTIQHGIAFDIPGNMIAGFWGKNPVLQRINKMLRCIKNANRLKHTKNTVCVDYNYYNWYRTLDTITTNVKVIPNYSLGKLNEDTVKTKINNISYPLNIVFARRFVDYRGTLIFANAMERLIKEGYVFNLTFAGSGPLLSTVKKQFENYKNIEYTSFDSKDSIAFHTNFDISVVPTIFSEGTSLSLAESMSAGCIPIATHVGGMTNMILSGYNGFLCSPNEESLYKQIKEILDSPLEDIRRVAFAAYYSSCCAFSKEKWSKEWLAYISEIFTNL